MNSFEKALAGALASGAALTVENVADGSEALVVAAAARARFAAGIDAPTLITYVARDAQRLQAMEDALGFVAPEIECLTLPGWDCQPYDRASPNAPVLARRMTTLSRLATSRGGERPRVLITSIEAILQRLPPRAWVAAQALSAAPGNAMDLDALVRWLELNGFQRSSTVRDVGEYAVRGGIVDLSPPGPMGPIRLDFFGDTLESIRGFDPETQRSTHSLARLDLVPMTEFQLTSETIRRFRQGYVEAFGAPQRGDLLYESVSEGRRFPGMEHWLPLFHGGLDMLAAYTAGAALMFDAQADGSADERFRQIADYYEARRSAFALGSAGGTPYRPLPADALYLARSEWQGLREAKGTIALTPFALPPGTGKSVSLRATIGRSFAAERAAESGSVFDAVVAHVSALQGRGRRAVIASWTDGARQRLAGVLADHRLGTAKPVASLLEAQALAPSEAALAVFPLEAGFETPDLAVISEQDILGERMTRTRRLSKRSKDFIAEVSSLTAGDIVVHVDHGIGRFIGLKTIEVGEQPHDCLELHYAGGDRLFLPVENIELLSRYGSEETDVSLDRLGGGAWQARKSRLKKRIRDMARALMKIAAARFLNEAPKFVPPPGVYDEFRARFPYEETDDQQDAIDATLGDLASGKPMDRLICGDVGFGKTEVALRAIFAAVMAGKQAALVVPTTLLARQHFKTVAERFHGLPVRVAQASRLVPNADLKKAREELAAGTLDIVVGTHALLGKQVKFKDLGLIVIDEEQHFGVAHKERLKDLKAEAHVLTLSATPIPRTLQLALTGVRELSIIATPPVDRLAVRTFIAPFDTLAVREALLRERYRGGQSFYVVPRIEDLAEVSAFLSQNVPEVKVAVGHGQMAASDLEDVMGAFYDGKFDVLLSTTIVESGLDIPRANTLIVHRADMFGLAQLYQLRGRVGRSKTRAFALFTLPVNKPLTPTAERRLKVLQSLDTLGAGFQLASHDLDIRGAGNLLGEEQSGHIKEVGYELYQQMLQEAVADLKAGVEEREEEQWSPSIGLGAPVLIPETYIADLDLRMGLYRRLAVLATDEEIESFAAEMIDRFGPLPQEVEQLFRIVTIKALCRRANIEKVDAGPKGLILAFRDNAFANPAGLVRYISDFGSTARVRPDMRVVIQGDFEKLGRRIDETRRVLHDLVRIAERKKAA